MGQVIPDDQDVRVRRRRGQEEPDDLAERERLGVRNGLHTRGRLADLEAEPPCRPVPGPDRHTGATRRARASWLPSKATRVVGAQALAAAGKGPGIAESKASSGVTSLIALSENR